VVNPGTDFSIFPRHNAGAGDRSIEIMFLTKWKTAALALPACLVFTGTSFLMHQALAEQPPQAQAKAGSNAATQGGSDAVRASGRNGDCPPEERGQSPFLPDALTELTPAQFGKFHALLRPKAKEMRFGQIPWMFDLWEARKKAAAEGKPLLILGAAGNPLGTC
jgi:hypothetical protein